MRVAPLVLSILITAPVSAQFRLPKPHIPNPINRVTAQAGDPRAPTYDDRVLEITDARAGAVLKGLKAEQDARPSLQGAYKRNSDARAAAAVAGRGPEEQAQNCLANSPEFRAATTDTGGMMAMIARVQALQAKGDYAAIQVIADSSSHAAAKRDSALTVARQRCEAAAARPVATPPEAPRIGLADSLHVIGAAAAGVTPDQYSILRERVQAYLTMNDADLRSSMYVYGANEMAVLRNRRAQFAPYTTMLSDE